MRNPLAFGLEGPLEPYAEAFAKQLREQGYAPRTVQNKLHVVAKLSHWLGEHQLPVEVLNGQRVCAFLQEFQKEERRACHGDPTTLRGLLKQLSDDGVIAEPSATVDEGAQAEIVQKFSRYLIQERGLSAATLDNYVVVVGRFLTHRCRVPRCAGLASHALRDSRTHRSLDMLYETLMLTAHVVPPAVSSWASTRSLKARQQLVVPHRTRVPTCGDYTVTSGLIYRGTRVPNSAAHDTHRFGEGSVDLAALQAHDLTGFVLAQAHRLSPKPAQLMVTALRSFLRFLYQRGQIAVDLAAAVPTVADWRLARVPKYLQPEQVERLLESCDQGTVVGQRDYSILLLLARLGLRAGEVVHLHLEDIDWTEGLLTVRGKGGRWRQLPLPVDVGEAVARYLRWGRPPCTSRRVFVRMRAPRAGFASSVAIDCIVSRALARAGLNPPSRGAHLLRHSMATGMLRSGASLAEIGQLLGHRLPQSTEIYAKVDERALADLAQPWPGGTP